MLQAIPSASKNYDDERIRMRKIIVISTSTADFGHLSAFLRVESKPDSLSIEIWSLGPSRPLVGKYPSSATLRWFGVSSPRDSHDWSNYLSELNQGLHELASKALDDLGEFAILILGDRLELLSVCQFAISRKIPIIHLHGGEVSQGSTDDLVRHSITQMASFHFPSTEDHAANLLSMGEESSRISCEGALALDNVLAHKVKPRRDVEKALKIGLPSTYAVASFHPPTYSQDADSEINMFLDTLAAMPIPVFVTPANHDPGGEKINAALCKLADVFPHIKLLPNLGLEKFLDLLQHSRFLLGNSSSGLIEAPLLGVPSVDMGTRQAGRSAPGSVIRVRTPGHYLSNTVQELCASQRRIERTDLYGQPSVAHRVLARIATIWPLLFEQKIKHFRGKP